MTMYYRFFVVGLSERPIGAGKNIVVSEKSVKCETSWSLLEERAGARESRNSEAGDVSRETPASPLGHGSPPPQNFKHEILEIAGRYPGNSPRPGQRFRAYFIKLLARFSAQGQQLRVG